MNDFYEMSESQKQKFHDTEIRELRLADVAIFEVSTPSIGLGHFVTKSLEFGKPTILLHTKGNKPFVFYETDDQRVIIVEYSMKNLAETLTAALTYAQEQTLTRYHFVIDPQQEKYLKWITEKKNIPRAVYLRELIQKDMELEK